MSNEPRRRLGFTLVEMMVVLIVITLVSTIAVPSVARTIKSAAKAQSYNLMASMVRAARTTALRQRQFALLHHQVVDDEVVGNRSLHNKSYLAVMMAGGLKAATEEVQVTASMASGIWMSSSGDGGEFVYVNLDGSETSIGAVNIPVTVPAGDESEATYEVYIKWPDAALSSSAMCNGVPVRIGSETGYVDMTGAPGRWVRVRRFELSGNSATVVIDPTPGTRGAILVGAVRIIRVGRSTVFTGARGQVPMQMPSTFTAGEMTEMTVNATANTFLDSGVGIDKSAASDEIVADFTSFSILFNRHGMMARRVNGSPILFDEDSSFFQSGLGVWDIDVANDHGAGEDGVAAVAVFDYQEFTRQRGTGGSHVTYLNQNAQMVAPNQQTGQVYRPR